jgi:hypothetical protein
MLSMYQPATAHYYTDQDEFHAKGFKDEQQRILTVTPHCRYTLHLRFESR